MAPESGNIYWIRQDLRLKDNPALCAALAHGGEEHTVIPVYIWAPHEEGQWPPGGATRVWLHHSLKSLAADLEKLGSRLVIINTGPDQPYGGSLEALRALAEQC